MTTLVEHGYDLSGTTSQRPAAADNGCRYWNTTTKNLEIWSEADSAWLTANGSSVATADSPVTAVSGATVKDYALGGLHYTTVTFADVDFPLTDEAGTVAYGGLKILDLPAGYIRFMGCVSDIDLTKDAAGVNDDWDGDFGIGTVTASNNATLASTEQNILPTTATPQASSGATTANGVSTATEHAVIIDGTSTAADVYFNILVDDADHDVTSTATNLILNGTVNLLWANLGDV